MNWKIKLVLLFAKFRKPIDASTVKSIPALRRKSDRAAWLGSLLFDKKIQIHQVTDVVADGVPIRIYQNSNRPGQRVIVFYHGGGFVLYGIYSHDYVCRRLCRMNDCIVVSVNYRLAPEHLWPAAHEDAYTALQWVRNHIEEHGGNPQDVVVAGDSAGGNLSACMAHRCKEEGTPLKAQVLIYPWIDGRMNSASLERNAKGFLLERDTMFWFREQYSPRPEDHCRPELSPCFETDFSGLAPAFILTAELDPLLDDGYNYYQQLKSGGTSVRYRQYPHLFHGFINTPGVSKEATEAFSDIQDFLQNIY